MANKRKEYKKIQIDRIKYVESVFHIVFYGNTIKNFQSLLNSASEKLTENERMLLRYSVQWNVLMITISLIDELNGYLFNYEGEDILIQEKINSFKHIVEPALNEIDRWPDIRSFRNHVLAHNFRIDKDNFVSVHLSDRLHSYKIPATTIDLITLFKFLDSITAVAEEIFADEYKEAFNIVNGFNAAKNLTQSIDEEINRINTVLAEMNMRIAEYNSQKRLVLVI